MGKKKSATQTTATYQYMTPPSNPYFESAGSLLNNIDFRTPVTEQYGKLKNQINESGGDFLGPNTSPEVAAKVRKGQLFRAMTDYGENYSNATQQENAAKINGEMGLGYATAPQLVQSGGTANSQQWGGIMQNFGNNLGGSLGSTLGM